MILGDLYLTDTRERMCGVKRLGEGALTQLHSEDWHRVLSPGGNSAAVLVQHLAGNMESRWGALRGGYREGVDGEAPGRNRDAEFEEGGLSGGALLARWQEGWSTFLAALDALNPEDLTRTLTIRHETHTVLAAIQRQVAHYSGHVYQLVLLAKTLRGENWQTLSVPRGGSAAFNAEMQVRHAEQPPSSQS
ncbi:DUF1572 family protein [Deinococcus hopiensis]|uniref:DinB superfamily protein n=1 Tax=Deinococcus hopiensis KR-140 TaxID=695939 RepID=A0A1W1VJF1_9DEIO|nr:DUF1572 family protein [Deinococcus hopiensis]SMB93509.1 Protein of unknown function [Deinococcus hopiensis KR-140]